MEIISGNVVDISPDGYIIARAALVGLDRAVREMITAIDSAQGK